jgi:large subunit ribosomal protein L6
MSRIGKKPVPIPAGVTATLSGQRIEARGPKGVLAFQATDEIELAVADGRVTVTPRNDTKRARQQWGMSRSMIENLFTGVTKGFRKDLDITGVGYRAAVQGATLKLTLGYSHDVSFAIPEGVRVTTPKPTEIGIEGIDAQLVGEVAAQIRAWRKPEPYQGKGIRYRGEYIFRKAGKKK